MELGEGRETSCLMTGHVFALISVPSASRAGQTSPPEVLAQWTWQSALQASGRCVRALPEPTRYCRPGHVGFGNRGAALCLRTGSPHDNTGQSPSHHFTWEVTSPTRRPCGSTYLLGITPSPGHGNLGHKCAATRSGFVLCSDQLHFPGWPFSSGSQVTLGSAGPSQYWTPAFPGRSSILPP